MPKRARDDMDAKDDFVIFRMTHRDGRHYIYVAISQERWLSGKNQDPKFYGQGGTVGMVETGLNEEMEGVVRAQLREMVDTGGYVMVDAVQMAGIGRATKRRRVEFIDRREREQSPDGLASEFLCRCCKEVVRTSAVLNREARSMGTVQNLGVGGEITVQEEVEAPWVGSKVNVYKHHERLGRLKLSALSGCHLCSLIDVPDPTVSIPYDENSTTPYVLKVMYGRDHRMGPGVIVLDLNVRPRVSRAVQLEWGKPPQQFSRTVTCNSTNSEPVIELSKKWLNDCLQYHVECRMRASTSTDFIPTRLLQVKVSGSIIQSIQLVFGNKLPYGTEYLTLSHCWGGAEILKLKKDSLVPFQSHVPVDELPKNFVDAAILTAQLGYDYIWIDSLCIIQDSPEDWAEEAARMGAVYRHSVCTIAAAGANDSHGGCFTDRAYLSITPCQLVSDTPEKPGVYASEIFKNNKNLLHTKLHTRAWVVQERCLSIRTLNFGSPIISWECIETEASEQQPRMVSTSYANSVKRTFNDLISDSSREWIDAWWKLISEYSSCDITFKTDKWPAMKGLATEIENECAQDLVHGLWAHNFTDDLLWTIYYPELKRLDISVPSWSWLGVDGQVWKRKYDYDNEHYLEATAFLPAPVNSQITGSRSDQYSFEISVTGRMLPIEWAFDTQKDPKHTPGYNFRFVDGIAAEGPGARLRWVGRWIPDVKLDLSSGERWEAWAIQFVKTRDKQEWKSRAGLIVSPVPGRLNFFKRIGFYEIGWRDDTHVDENLPKKFFGFRETVTLV
ncbi:HET-domain-containing protein [Corynespora cassiicola Philippines]|uniref:HET-domain-containing protein n=1 Tax=Corynespora cassiicola Philippines TaxID=1448308 RepID=A0A2T2NGX6_CORCC|nr:HET-domain-containing protein [Corynespora cassiicola Philippines]